MKQTEYAGLNQWDLTDRIQMKDFNADNQRIDEALQCHPSGELLARIDVDQEAEKLEIDLGGVDWSRYLALILTLESSSTENIFISMNSRPEGSIYIYKMDGLSERSEGVAYFPTASRLTLVIPVLYSGNHAPNVLAFGLSDKISDTFAPPHGLLSGGGGTKHLNKCGKITIDRNRRPFYPGDRCALWGVK